MRIVHLLDQASPQASPSTLALIAQSFGRLGDIDQHLILAGGSKMVADAEAVGLKVGEDVTKISTPYGKGYLAYPAIRRALKRIGDIDIIHCWSVGTLSLAAIMARHKRTVTTLTVSPNTKQINWLRVLVSDKTLATSGSHAMLPVSSTIAQNVLSCGLDEQLVHVLRPGIDMGMVQHSQRDALQAKWRKQMQLTDFGDGPVKFISLISDPPASTSATDITLAITLAEDSKHDDDTKIALVVSPNQHNRYRAKKMFAHLDRPGHIIEEPLADQPWRYLPGCDIAIAIGPDAGGLSLIWAMAANIPIIGQASHVVSEIVEDRHSALLSSPPQPKQLAHHIRQLIDDPQLAYKLRDTARHEAYSYFSRSQYCKGLVAAYEQIAEGRQIELPEIESTGGLRFTGRG